MKRGYRGRRPSREDPATALLFARAELWSLGRPLADLYNLGFFDGRASLEGALLRAESAADRFYRRAFEPPHSSAHVPAISFADLCRIRGEWARAQTAEEGLARRFAERSEGV